MRPTETAMQSPRIGAAKIRSSIAQHYAPSELQIGWGTRLCDADTNPRLASATLGTRSISDPFCSYPSCHLAPSQIALVHDLCNCDNRSDAGKASSIGSCRVPSPSKRRKSFRSSPSHRFHRYGDRSRVQLSSQRYPGSAPPGSLKAEIMASNANKGDPKVALL